MTPAENHLHISAKKRFFLLEQVVNGNCENDKDSLLALIENNYL